MWKKHFKNFLKKFVKLVFVQPQNTKTFKTTQVMLVQLALALALALALRITLIGLMPAEHSLALNISN